MFGSDGSPIVQYLVIFAIIFSVLAAIVFVVRRLTGGGRALQTRGARARQPRLGIIDVYELDRSRQLILLRRDNVEHLLLVGGPNDVVVERNIQRGQRPLPEAALRGEPAAEPLPDPLAEAGRLPEPPLAIAEGAARRAEPAFEMPVVVPAPVPGSHTPPPVRLPIDAALIAGDEPGRDIPVPAPEPAPVAQGPVAQGPVAKGPVARTRPGRKPPSIERPADTVRPTDPGFVLPPLTTPPSEPRPVDPSILSDMARQLQAAIARPSSAVAPPPSSVTPPAPAAPVAKPEPEADPLAAMMASLTPRIDPVAPASPPKPKSEPELVKSPPAEPSPAPPPPEPLPAPAPPQPIPAPAPAPAPAETPAAAPPPPPPPPPPRPPRPPEQARPVPPPQPIPAPAPPQPEAKSPGNPFSVEEIEAEFARLLGRPLDKR